MYVILLVLAAALAVTAQEFVVVSIRPGTNNERMYTLTSNDTRTRIPNVVKIVPNREISLASSTVQWNVARTGTPLPVEKGKDVDVYIVDTGVQGDHPAFTGRVQRDIEDCHGHGTHVAGTAAGVGYGIATEATIISVKILDCYGKGTLFSYIQGMLWVKQSMLERPTQKAVINLSIQSGMDDTIDELVEEVYRAGAVVVVAAANFNSDACYYSPARVPVAITVGATSEDDCKLSTSNYGKCVDVYAPGDNVLSAYLSDSSTVRRGTSMASPLVAGIVAVTWQQYPGMSNAQVSSYVTSSMTVLLEPNDCDTQSIEGKPLIQSHPHELWLTPKTYTQPLEYFTAVLPYGRYYLKVNGKLVVVFRRRSYRVVGQPRVSSRATWIRIRPGSLELEGGIVPLMGTVTIGGSNRPLKFTSVKIASGSL